MLTKKIEEFSVLEKVFSCVPPFHSREKTINKKKTTKYWIDTKNWNFSFHFTSAQRSEHSTASKFISIEKYLSCTHFGCFSSPIESIFYSISKLSTSWAIRGWNRTVKQDGNCRNSPSKCREWKSNSRFLVSWSHTLCSACERASVREFSETKQRKVNEPRHNESVGGQHDEGGMDWKMSCCCRNSVCVGGKFD